MLIVGSISTKEEADEIIQIAKFFAVGQRARFLGQESINIDKIVEETLNDLDKTAYLKYFGKHKK